MALDLTRSLIDDPTAEVLTTEQARCESIVAVPDIEAYIAAMNDALARFGNDLAGTFAQLPQERRLANRQAAAIQRTRRTRAGHTSVRRCGSGTAGSGRNRLRAFQ